MRVERLNKMDGKLEKIENKIQGLNHSGKDKDIEYNYNCELYAFTLRVKHVVGNCKSGEVIS